MEDQKQLLANLVSELRRGTLILSVLAVLRQQQYGYSLVAALEAHGIAIEAGTLYPLLRRLEKQGLLDSEWTVDQNRPRRYYKLNQSGEAILFQLADEWRRLNSVLESLVTPPGGSA